MQFLYSGLALTIAILASGFALLSSQSGAVIYFLPDTSTSTTHMRLGVYVDAARPINVVSGRIIFPKDEMSVQVHTTDESMIDLWLEEPKVTQELGEIRFAGGTSQKLESVEKKLLFYIDATRTGTGQAAFDVVDIQVLERDGRGSPLTTISRAYVAFNDNSQPTPSIGSGVSTTLAEQSDFNADGHVTIGDLSIFLINLVGAYDARYDLNRDGTVGFSDLSSLLTVYGK